MATFLFDAHVFGPISSRRLGSSLGINLLSTHQKVCNFNCIYCECGETHKLEAGDELYVDTNEFFNQLEHRIQTCVAENVPIDAITFAGNGEPTLHPDFPEIMDKVVSLRDKHVPDASIAVLTNGYTLDKKPIVEALKKADKAMIKLDAGDSKTFHLIDRPKGNIAIEDVAEHIRSFSKTPVIQSMFLKGNVNGVLFNNSKGKALEDWLDLIKKLTPSQVMIYSIDRDTPINTLEKIEKQDLLHIAQRLEKLGFKTLVV
jgi:wyosine [tRNA(Phe)-imidazoG37] synthetase (radical SAM superfamily)